MMYICQSSMDVALAFYERSIGDHKFAEYSTDPFWATHNVQLLEDGNLALLDEPFDCVNFFRITMRLQAPKATLTLSGHIVAKQVPYLENRTHLWELYWAMKGKPEEWKYGELHFHEDLYIAGLCHTIQSMKEEPSSFFRALVECLHDIDIKKDTTWWTLIPSLDVDKVETALKITEQLFKTPADFLSLFSSLLEDRPPKAFLLDLTRDPSLAPLSKGLYFLLSYLPRDEVIEMVQTWTIGDILCRLGICLPKIHDTYPHGFAGVEDVTFKCLLECGIIPANKDTLAKLATEKRIELLNFLRIKGVDFSDIEEIITKVIQKKCTVTFQYFLECQPGDTTLHNKDAALELFAVLYGKGHFYEDFDAAALCYRIQAMKGASASDFKTLVTSLHGQEVIEGPWWIAIPLLDKEKVRTAFQIIEAQEKTDKFAPIFKALMSYLQGVENIKKVKVALNMALGLTRENAKELDIYLPLEQLGQFCADQPQSDLSYELYWIFDGEKEETSYGRAHFKEKLFLAGVCSLLATLERDRALEMARTLSFQEIFAHLGISPTSLATTFKNPTNLMSLPLIKNTSLLALFLIHWGSFSLIDTPDKVQSLLTIAATSSWINVLDLLERKGMRFADVKGVLFSAAHKGNKETFQYLIEHSPAGALFKDKVALFELSWALQGKPKEFDFYANLLIARLCCDIQMLSDESLFRALILRLHDHRESRTTAWWMVIPSIDLDKVNKTLEIAQGVEQGGFERILLRILEYGGIYLEEKMMSCFLEAGPTDITLPYQHLSQFIYQLNRTRKMSGTPLLSYCLHLLSAKGIQITDDTTPAYRANLTKDTITLGLIAKNLPSEAKLIGISPLTKLAMIFKKIGHINSLQGFIQLPHEERELTLDLEAFDSAYFYAEWIKVLSSSTELVEAFSFAANSASLPNKEIVDHIRSDKLTILPITSRSHALTLFFYDNKIILCNTNEKTAYCFDINPLLMTETLIHQIRTYDSSWIVMLDTLPARLSHTTKSVRSKTDLNLKIKFQKVGNCTFASSRAALDLALRILKVPESELLGKKLSAELLERALTEGHQFLLENKIIPTPSMAATLAFAEAKLAKKKSKLPFFL